MKEYQSLNVYMLLVVGAEKGLPKHFALKQQQQKPYNNTPIQYKNQLTAVWQQSFIPHRGKKHLYCAKCWPKQTVLQHR